MEIITQKVPFSTFYTIFIQSIKTKNDSLLLERSIFVMVCSHFYFFEIPCTYHIWKKLALSKSKILNSINNFIWPVEILAPLDEFHLKEYCQ